MSGQVYCLRVRIRIHGDNIAVRHRPLWVRFANIDPPQELLDRLNVACLLIGGYILDVQVKGQRRIKHSPRDAVHVRTDRLLYPLPIPVAGQRAVPRAAVRFDFHHQTRLNSRLLIRVFVYRIQRGNHRILRRVHHVHELWFNEPGVQFVGSPLTNRWLQPVASIHRLIRFSHYRIGSNLLSKQLVACLEPMLTMNSSGFARSDYRIAVLGTVAYTQPFDRAVRRLVNQMTHSFLLMFRSSTPYRLGVATSSQTIRFLLDASSPANVPTTSTW